MTTSRHWIPVLAALAFCLAARAAPAAEGDARITAVRTPILQERVLPAAMVEVGPGHYFVDFGRAAFGGLELEVAKPEDGRRITVRMGEAVSEPRKVHRQPGGSIRYHETNLVLRAGQTVYAAPLRNADRRLMSDEIGPVMPFRYVELENAPALEARHVRQVAAHYAFRDDASSFRCSDPRLNAIWDLCKHTMKATSFGGVFIDGDRERKPYEADAFINQLGWYCCTDDVTLPRYSHEYLILHPTWPTEWIMFSVLMAWEDYRYTGDPASARAFYDDLKAKTLIDLERPDGLISTVQPPFPKRVGDAIHIKGIRDIVDWPAGERDGCEMLPVNTVVNAFHCHALGRMADLAAALGKPDDERRFNEAAVRALKSLNDKLVDPATGLYVDGEGSRHSSQHANLFPLAFGLVPRERAAKVASFVKSRGMACSVYAAQFLMDALFDAGLGADAVALMTADGDRSWTHMIERVGTTISLEAWDSKYKPNQDWNHAWGAAPANLLPRKVLGVEPLEPGFAKILIRPRPCGLASAEGRIPTVRGPVRVGFSRAAGEFRMDVDVPARATARVGVPAAPGARITLDGKPVRATDDGGCAWIDPVGAGAHRIVATGN